MLGNRRNEDRGFNRLPKQAGLPTLKQLQAMLSESLKAVGRTTQLPFGDPPEDYSLAVFKDRGKGDLHWALYRGDGSTSMLVWDQVSMDPGYIHQLITAQFPGFDLKPVALRSQPTFQASSTRELQTAWDNYEQQSTSMRMRAKATLEGDLKNLQIPNVLQSIGMSKGTGRLEVESPAENAVVFFVDGLPVHCELGNLDGGIAILELVGWEEGEFRFYPEAATEKRTIRKRLDTLLMEGAALDDQYKAIRQKGIKENSFLIRVHDSLTESQFEKLLENGTGCDMNLQKQLYQQIDNKSRLSDILRRFNLTKLDWVPIIFNFATCNMVNFVDRLADSAADDNAVSIDWSQSRAVDRLLMRQDTGLYTYPTLLWMLEREFSRWESFSRPFSLILMEIAIRPTAVNQIIEPLPISGIKEFAERVSRFKRKTDVLAHYETFGYALLLPETEGHLARNMAARLSELLESTPLSGGMSGYPLMVSLGTACLPEDSLTVGSLLGRSRPKRLD